MNSEIEKLRQRAVPGSQVVGLPRYPVDDIKKGQKYATALPRWISGDTYEGQMYIIDIATEDIKGNSEGVVFRPYAKSVLKYFIVKSNPNWGDEIDFEGFDLFTEDELNAIKTQFMKGGQYYATTVNVSYGTNEDDDISSNEVLRDLERAIPITEEQYIAIHNVIGTHYGTTKYEKFVDKCSD